MALLRQCLEQVRAKRVSCQEGNSGLPHAIAAEGAAPSFRPFLSLEHALISESSMVSSQEKTVVITVVGAGGIGRDIVLTALSRWRIACLARGVHLGRSVRFEALAYPGDPVRITVTINELLVKTTPRGAQVRMHHGRKIVVDGEASVMPTSRRPRLMLLRSRQRRRT